MCEPATAALIVAGVGAAASAAGTMVSAQSNKATVEAQSRSQNEAARISAAAREAERGRQDQYAKEALSRWDQNVQATGPQPVQNTIDDTARRVQENTREIQDPTFFGMLPGQDDVLSGQQRKVVAGEVARGADAARKRTAALAQLTGYDTLGSAWDTNNRLFGANLGLGQSIARGSMGIGQVEGNVPGAQVTPGMGATLGTVMTGLGNAAVGAGMSYGALGGAKGAGGAGQMQGPPAPSWYK